MAVVATDFDKWADHIGKIDRHIAFELFRRHESENYAAAARILDETPFVEMRMTAEDRWPWGQPRIPSRVRDLTARRSVSLTQELRAAVTELPMTRALEAWVTEG